MDFFKFEFLNTHYGLEESVTMQYFIKFGKTVAEAIYHFSRWQPYAILDLRFTFWDHPQEYLQIFTILQNLVGISAVVLMLQKYEYFGACLA